MSNTVEHHPATQYRIGVALTLAAATGFASKAIFVKLAYQYHPDAITLLALRMGFALLFLLPLLLWRRWRQGPSQRPPLLRRDIGAVLLLGLLGYYLSSLLDFLGLLYISASLERLILFLFPTLTVLLAAVWLKQPLTRRSLAALVLSYAGIALVVAHDLSSQQPGYWRGVLLVMAGTASYAVYLVGSQRVIGRIGAGRFTELMLLISGGLLISQFLLLRPLSALLQPLPVLLYAAAMGLIATLLPIYWLAAGMARIGASRAAQIGSVGPALTLLMGAAVLGERLTGWQLAGTALVFLGVAVVSKR